MLPIRISVLVMLAAGCGRIESEKVSTDSMFADITAVVEASSGSTTIRAVLSDSAEPLELTGGDIWFAYVQGTELVMGPPPVEEDSDEVRPYEATYDEVVEDEEITVALERRVSTPAPETLLSTPPTFSLIEHEEAADRSMDIELEWQPATSDGMRLELSGDCLSEDLELEVEDPSTGIYVLPADSLSTTSDSGDVCLVDVRAVRYRAGSLDPAFAGGSAVAEATREMVLETKSGS